MTNMKGLIAEKLFINYRIQPVLFLIYQKDTRSYKAMDKSILICKRINHETKEKILLYLHLPRVLDDGD